MRLRLVWVGALCVVSALFVVGCHDRVLFDNENGSGDIGMLLDGNLGGGDLNDQSFTTTATGHVDPGDVSAGGHNEIISYQQERPVHLEQFVRQTGGGMRADIYPIQMLLMTVSGWVRSGSMAVRYDSQSISIVASRCTGPSTFVGLPPAPSDFLAYR